MNTMEKGRRGLRLMMGASLALSLCAPAQALPFFAKTMTTELGLKRTSCTACHVSNKDYSTRTLFGERFEKALPEGLAAQYLTANQNGADPKLLEQQLNLAFAESIPRVMEQKLGDFTVGELVQLGKVKGVKPKRR